MVSSALPCGQMAWRLRSAVHVRAVHVRAVHVCSPVGPRDAAMVGADHLEVLRLAEFRAERGRGQQSLGPLAALENRIGVGGMYDIRGRLDRTIRRREICRAYQNENRDLCSHLGLPSAILTSGQDSASDASRAMLVGG